jgi:protein gp37
MQKTAISWATYSWNPIHGCSKVGPECDFCYAETLSLKKGFTQAEWTRENAEENVTLKPHKLREPYRMKEPGRVFVNSMSDLFHPLVPDSYIAQVFEIMNDPALAHLTFQVLTKRPERAAKWGGPWAANIWMGASIGHFPTLKRLDHLRRTGAAVTWVSAEPLIGAWADSVDLSGIDGIVVGGESGYHLAEAERAHKAGNDPRAVNPRWLDQAWARQVRDLCADQGVAYYYKQDSGIRTELRPWLVEADGTRWAWQQWPGHLIPPRRVTNQSAKEVISWGQQSWELIYLNTPEPASEPAQLSMF